MVWYDVKRLLHFPGEAHAHTHAHTHTHVHTHTHAHTHAHSRLDSTKSQYQSLKVGICYKIFILERKKRK